VIMMLRARTFLLWGMLSTLALFPFAMESGANVAQPPTGRADPEYAALVEQYRHGDFKGAIASLIKWPPERVRAVTRVPSHPRDLDITQTKAAVMLHSDVSMILAVVDQRLSRQHIDSARAWVQMLPNDAAARFKERWQVYAVGPYLVQYNPRFATFAVRQGLAAFPRSADLKLMEGTLLELTARSETSDFRGVWTTETGSGASVSNPTIARIENGLRAATVADQRALELDPSLLSARLRLGWVYDVNHSSTHAREQLRMVADRATSRELRYLAHLILGGLAEQGGRTDLAYEEYDTAHSIQTDAQTAHIALMRAARMTGRLDRAQRLFAEYTTRASGSEDPWWYFSMGLDAELIAWLHVQATLP
jgi:tetratricopeptide (TPR) repeat protein